MRLLSILCSYMFRTSLPGVACRPCAPPWTCTVPALLMSTPGAESEAIGLGPAPEGLAVARVSEYRTWPSVMTATSLRMSAASGGRRTLASRAISMRRGSSRSDPPDQVDVAALGPGDDGRIRVHVGEQQHGYEVIGLCQGLRYLVEKAHGGVGGHGQGACVAPDIGSFPAFPAVPFPFSEAVISPLDLQAEAANARDPQGEVQLERLLVPLPLVAGEARRPAGLQGLEDAPLRLSEGIVEPVAGE